MDIVANLNGLLHSFRIQDEYLPKGQAAMMMFASDISERYQFQASGESQAASQVGVLSPAFQSGIFILDGTPVPIISLEFQTQRVLVLCTITDHAVALIADLFTFLEERHKFRKPRRAVQNYFTSALVVDYGYDLYAMIAPLEKLRALVSDAVESIKLTVPLSLQTVRYAGAVQTDRSAMSVVFSIEERSGRPTGSNWLFTQAPLETNEHVKLMHDIGQVFRPPN